MNRFFYLLVFITLPSIALCQGEANYWYFGANAGVNFNTSPPTAITNGQLNTSEGCSSISDENGNLLFYTDGSTVWNRNHQIMSNANYFNGNGLNGDPSSTSSGLIVPHPTNPNLYYVFTVDEPHHDNADTYPNQGPGTPTGEYTDLPGSSVPEDDDGFNNGLNYSVVDMSLNNGLGNVIPAEKNVHLITYNPSDSEEIKYKCSEKITAVKGSDCNSIWLLTHFIDKFYAFKIDESGIDTTPIISEVGPTIPIAAYRRAAIGYMKISPNGKKLIIAHNTKTYNQLGNAAQNGGVYLNDFDDATGTISNSEVLVQGVNPYGVEFSMETKKAYATATSGNSAILYQWDLEAADIPGSIVTISGVSTNSATALQLAPNGKIYKTIISSSRLAVINNPELAANQIDYSENVIDGAIYLQGRNGIYGLPPFIQSIFSSRINIIDETSENIFTNLDLCQGDSYNLSYSQNSNAANTYTWYKDGEVIANEDEESIQISSNPNNQFPYTETYKLEINLNDGSCPLIGIANVTFHPIPEVNDISLTQCTLLDNDTSIFNLNDVTNYISELNLLNIEFYTNLSDAENSTNSIINIENFENTSNPQTIIAKIFSEFCSSYVEVELNVSNTDISPINLNKCATNDNGFETFDLSIIKTELLSLDPNFTVSFYNTTYDAVLEENEINAFTSFQNTSAFEQTIYARIDNTNLCEAIVPINLKVEDIIPLADDEELTYCLENFPSEVILESGIAENNIDNYTYFWQPSEENTPTIATNNITLHTVTVTHKITGCEVSRTINLLGSSKANFQVNIDGISNQNIVEIVVNEDSNGNYTFSIDDQFADYQTENIFHNVSAGEHIVYVKDLDGCGISSKKINILGVMKFFTPNQDGINDNWNLLGRNPENTQGIEIFIFDRFGKLLTSINPQGRGWDGSYNGKNMPSNDYWYLISLPNGKNYKGSFTLKR